MSGIGINMSRLLSEMNSELHDDHLVLSNLKQLCLNRRFSEALSRVNVLHFEYHRAASLEYIIHSLCNDSMSLLFYGVHSHLVQLGIFALEQLICTPSRTFSQLERCLHKICVLSDEISSHREFHAVWFKHIWPTAQRLATLLKTNEIQSQVDVNCVERFRALSCASKGAVLKRIAQPRISRLSMIKA